ncbi:CHAD domain-containing protein [Methanolobus sp. ZRKC3]|uniref:CHAD domain-containing protein n=1 Tax=Methanolobus sp. ZRKC3 TaxID=3125786 RepID=UPI0032485174
MIHDDLSKEDERFENGVALNMLASLPSLKEAGIIPDDSVRDAARKLLMFYFKKMLEHEDGTKLGSNIEELHDMRVAAMRMRSVIEVLEEYLDMKEMSSYFKSIKATRKHLGLVRDIDVFLEKIDAYIKLHPSENGTGIENLRVSMNKERKKRRNKMFSYLGSSKYNSFKNNFAAYLLDDNSWNITQKQKKCDRHIPQKVKDIIPILLYTQLANVRAYDSLFSDDCTIVPSFEQYHSLRINVKILRYTLEFFREVLDPKTDHVIKEFKILQDNLGDMHDAVVAIDNLKKFEKDANWKKVKQKKTNLSIEGTYYSDVNSYMGYCREKRHDLVKEFQVLWSKFVDPDFSVSFSQSIAGIYLS